MGSPSRPMRRRSGTAMACYGKHANGLPLKTGDPEETIPRSAGGCARRIRTPNLLIRSKFPPSAVLTCVFPGQVRAYVPRLDAVRTIKFDLLRLALHRPGEGARGACSRLCHVGTGRRSSNQTSLFLASTTHRLVTELAYSCCVRPTRCAQTPRRRLGSGFTAGVCPTARPARKGNVRRTAGVWVDLGTC